MPSSISSSKPPVPDKPLGRIAIAVCAIVVLFFAVWEIYWRGQGYAPTLNDRKALFASEWKRLTQHEGDGILLVGTSRTRFDLDHDVIAEATGHDPILLGINGAASWPILEAVAQHTDFHGTVICGVAPNFFWDGSHRPERKANDWIQYARHWSPSDQVGHRIATFLENRLAFLQQDDLSFHALVTTIPPPPPRAGAQGRAPFPPQMANIDPDGRERMLPRLAEGDDMQARLQEIWLSWLSHTPPPYAQQRAAQRFAIQEAIWAIEERGGKVIFLRLPSSGEYRQVEADRWPREEFWDDLIEDTGADGIHFEDHETLRDFECPEWSHLSEGDAVKFTKGLMEVLPNE